MIFPHVIEHFLIRIRIFGKLKKINEHKNAVRRGEPSQQPTVTAVLSNFTLVTAGLTYVTQINLCYINSFI